MRRNTERNISGGESMSFSVSGRISTDWVSFSQDAALTAFEKAVELLSRGASDVYVTDESGRVYFPDNLCELFADAATANSPRTWRERSSSETEPA